MSQHEQPATSSDAAAEPKAPPAIQAAIDYLDYCCRMTAHSDYSATRELDSNEEATKVAALQRLKAYFQEAC